MTYLFSFLLLISTITAKEIEVVYNDTCSYTYIDGNNDGRFEAVIVKNGESYEVKKIKKTIRRPNVKIYQKSKLSYRLVNYNDRWNDITFRIEMVYKGEVIGFWEKYYGRFEMKYKEIGNY